MTTDHWAPLAGQNYASLETFKRDGSGVKTPIWFANDGDSLVFMTSNKTWKVKRLKNNDQVKLAPCNMNGKKITGPWVEGKATPISDPDEIKASYKLIAKKHFSLRLVNPFSRLFGSAKKRVYYRISPAS